jgi:hypothetical protein
MADIFGSRREPQSPSTGILGNGRFEKDRPTVQGQGMRASIARLEERHLVDISAGWFDNDNE